LPKAHESSRLVRFERFELDLLAGELRTGTARIRLQDKSFRMLRLLLERAGEVVTREDLQGTLWTSDTVVEFDHGIATALKKLRRALGDDAGNPHYIETLARRGYRWMAEVEWADPDERQDLPSPAEKTIDSIAVLPFTNLSANPEQEYFCAGLAEEILNALTRIQGLKVIARTSAFAFSGKGQDIRQIGQALKVSSVLEGSVRQAGDRIRITVQLIHTGDGYHLWSETYDREITDIFAVQEEISQAIVSVLKVRFSSHAGSPLVQRGTSNLDAYQAYLEGRYHYQQLTRSHMARSRECLERAIRLDPVYALPHVGMAEYYYYLAFYLNARPRDVLPLGMAAAEKALALDPECAEAYTVRGTLRAVNNYDWNAAGEDFARAIELRPNLAIARHRRVAWFLRPMGRLEESFAETRQALELDPLNVLIRAAEPYRLQMDGKKSEALQRARDLIQLFPEH